MRLLLPARVYGERFMGVGTRSFLPGTGNDKGASELDDHVEVGRVGFGPVPRCVGSAFGGDLRGCRSVVISARS